MKFKLMKNLEKIKFFSQYMGQRVMVIEGREDIPFVISPTLLCSEDLVERTKLKLKNPLSATYDDYVKVFENRYPDNKLKMWNLKRTTSGIYYTLKDEDDRLIGVDINHSFVEFSDFTEDRKSFINSGFFVGTDSERLWIT